MDIEGTKETALWFGVLLVFSRLGGLRYRGTQDKLYASKRQHSNDMTGTASQNIWGEAINDCQLMTKWGTNIDCTAAVRVTDAIRSIFVFPISHHFQVFVNRFDCSLY